MAGDIIIVPAGVAHKNPGSSFNFAYVGAYPINQNFDMKYGKAEERPHSIANIRALALPDTDPVHGKDGELTRAW